MGIFGEEQRKTFSQIWVKISLCISFPINSYGNTEPNYDISFYLTRPLAVFSTGYLPWKCRCFRYLFPVFTTSLKEGWAQTANSALTFPHSCFKISYQNAAVPLGWDRKKKTTTGRHCFFSCHMLSPFFFFAKFPQMMLRKGLQKQHFFLSTHLGFIVGILSLSMPSK